MILERGKKKKTREEKEGWENGAQSPFLFLDINLVTLKHSCRTRAWHGSRILPRSDQTPSPKILAILFFLISYATPTQVLYTYLHLLILS